MIKSFKNAIYVCFFLSCSLALADATDADLISAVGLNPAISAQNYCLRGQAAYQCTGITSWAQGVCLSSGRAAYECTGVELGQGVCMSNKSVPAYQCTGVSLATAVCMTSGRAAYECTGVSGLSAICLSGGRPKYECNGINSLNQAFCLQQASQPAYQCSGL